MSEVLDWLLQQHKTEGSNLNGQVGVRDLEAADVYSHIQVKFLFRSIYCKNS